MDPVANTKVSEEEYLDLERKSETKHEYIHGEIVAMAGASPRHNLILFNVAGSLRYALKGRPCFVVGSDQRTNVSETGLYAYPDVAVVCGRVQVSPKDAATILNPVVIVEVLSESTESYDRGAKFAHYRRIPTLAEYVLVSQSERRVEHFRRVEGEKWLLTEYVGEGVVPLPALGMEVPLAEIYDKLDLVEAGSDATDPGTAGGVR